MLRTLATLCLTLTLSSPFARGAEPLVRIRDITQIAGEHPNQLTGMGLVIGLAGTGGNSQTTKQFALNLLQKMGNRADPGLRENIQRSQEKTDNMSVSLVTVTLPPHAKKGQRIDVTVSAFDNAKSLTGGILVATELYGPDGEVYVIASGPISLNGEISEAKPPASSRTTQPPDESLGAGQWKKKCPARSSKMESSNCCCDHHTI